MVNKVILVGNVCADPEVKSFSNGDKVANFRLATSERWKDKVTGERKEKSEFHRISVFGTLANVVESYVKKGSKLYIEGKIQTRSWEQDGVKKYATDIVLQGFGSTLTMLDSAKDSAPPQQAPAAYDDSSDEIPF